MKNLIIYDSYFENTEKIAKAVHNAFPQDKGCDIHKVSDWNGDLPDDLEILIVGSPTRQFSSTKAIQDFLKGIPSKRLEKVNVASFDTRIKLDTIKSSALRFMVDKGGYAAKTIARKLKNKGGKLLAPPEGFLVTGEQGPLLEGEIERAKSWAKALLVNETPSD